MLKKISEKIGYTKLVYDRVSKKLRTNYTKKQIEELVEAILNDNQTKLSRVGKKYYLWHSEKHIQLTINASSYRLITADRQEKIPISKKSAKS